MVVEDKRGTEESKLSPLARELFALLRHRSEVERRVVYDALVARLSAAPTSERPARILDALSLCMADIGRAPSRRDYDAWRDRLPDPREAPHSTQVRPAFESGRAARAALGEPMPDIVALRLVSRNRRAWSRAELIDALRRCGDALERRSFSFRRYSSFATDNRLPRSREQKRHRQGNEAVTVLASRLLGNPAT